MSIQKSSGILTKKEKQKRLINLFKATIIVVLSSLLTWIPLSIFSILAFAKKTFINYDNYYYIFFLFLPLNPLVNPFVHSSFNIRDKIQLKKQIKR